MKYHGSSKKLFVIFSTADYDHRPPTNKQLMAKTLGEMGHQVLYINSIGLRRPFCNGYDFMRILQRLKKVGTGKPRDTKSGQDIKSSPKNIDVLSLFVCPAYFKLRSSLVNIVTEITILVQLQVAKAQIHKNECIFIFYHPFVQLSWLWFLLYPKSPIILHLVDDLSALPWIDDSLYEDSLRKIASLSTIVLCTNPALLENTLRICPFLLNTKTLYQDCNRVELKCTETSKELLTTIELMSSPLLMVANLSPLKVDFELLAGVMANTSSSLHIVGSIDSTMDVGLFNEFCSSSYINYLGYKSLTELTDIATGYCFGIICQPFDKYNHSSTPMKFLDYINMGIIPIVRDMPYVRLYNNFIFYTFNDYMSFSEVINNARNLHPSTYLDIVRHNKNLLGKYTYVQRVQDIINILDQNIHSQSSLTLIRGDYQ